MGCICTKSLYRTSPSECRHHPRIVSTTERNPPEVTKPKEAVEGRKIRCHIHRSSLGSCLVVQYYTHSTHFLIWTWQLFLKRRTPYHREEMSALHFTRCERWKVEKNTPLPLYNSLKRKKKKKMGKKNPSQTEWKQIQKINKSTIGAAAEKGNIAEKLQRRDLKLWLHQ